MHNSVLVSRKIALASIMGFLMKYWIKTALIHLLQQKDTAFGGFFFVFFLCLELQTFRITFKNRSLLVPVLII